METTDAPGNTALPAFRYHPDPLDTGSVVASDTVCVGCNQSLGYIYTGPVYAVQDYEDRLCPWCIADGVAHARLNAAFQDSEAVPGWTYFDAPEVSEEIVEEVCWRTPGFTR
jgi:uncharacterized protein CbrC (UPF0167 family)